MKNKVLGSNLFFSRTNDFLNHYLNEQAGKSINTSETYRDGLTVFRRYITDIKKISIRKFTFTECTHELMLDYLHYLKDDCHNVASTCNNRLSALRAYLWYAADVDISLQSVAISASHVPFLKEPREEKAVIPDKALSSLFMAPPNTRKGIRDRTILILLYDTAMRVSELLNLTVASVRFSSPASIHIHGKGDKERVVSITERTEKHLKKYLKHYHPSKEPDKPLFYTTIKGVTAPMSQGNIARIINKYAEQIRPEHPDLPEKIHAHMFRRTRATGLYRAGVEMELISVILGHSSTQTTRIYATPSLEMLRKAMESSSEIAGYEEAEWLADEEELARLCGLR